MKPASTRKPKSRAPRTKAKALVAERYELQRELGRGGAGVVYLAIDRKTRNRPVALKVVPRKRNQDPFLAASLKNEFAALTLLSHPHLAKVHDFGMTEQEFFLSSEWVDGTDVLTAVQEMNLNTVFQVLLQTLRAIDYLHRRGVLHLDLKPTNILVTDAGRTGEVTVKLIDFGLARLPLQRGEAAEEFSGTPPYSAPEVLMGKEPMPESDLYSLGILYHQLFAKALPFHATDPLAILQEQLYGTPLRVASLDPALPDDFSDILWKMIQKEAAERFSSPRELLAAINRCLGENYSLRPRSAPVKILEESDHRFRGKLFEELLENFSGASPKNTLLSGPKGIGKSRLLRGVKEALQLKGIFPILLTGKDGLSEFLSAAEWKAEVPLFLDEAVFDAEQGRELAAAARERGVAFFAAGREISAAASGETLRRMELSPLSFEEVADYLKKELINFPLESWGVELLNRSRGVPGELEHLLRALYEEGAVQWTDLGWSWVEGTTGDLTTLLATHHARWEERRYRIEDFLRFSPTAWSAADLAGILALEPGGLEDKLEEWAAAGAVRKEEKESAALYLAPRAAELGGAEAIPKDWEKVRTELSRLYEHGHHRIGAHWADLLTSHFAGKIPEDILLGCARHYVAQGWNEKGLRTLPSEPPSSLSLRGLYEEIRSRAEFNLGKPAEAAARLESAKQAYQEAGDGQGLARAWNLEGSIEKKRLNLAAAETAYRQAAAQAETLKNGYVQAIAEMNLATLEHDRGHFEAAQAAYLRVAELSERIAHPTLACLFRHNWVNLLYHMGRSQEAESVGYEWLRLAIQNRYVEQEAAALNYLALLSGQKNQRERQLNYLNQAVLVLRDGDHSRPLFQTLINRGYFYWNAENYPAAQLDAEAAREVAERSHNPAFGPWAYLLLGKIHRDRKKPDYPAAEVFLEKARVAIVAGQRRQLFWEVQLDLGLLAKRRGDRERAKSFLLAARDALQELMTSLPESQRSSFLRDRKIERILSELEGL